jgi:outer membrane lipoprotein-sorting protein
MRSSAACCLSLALACLAASPGWSEPSEPPEQLARVLERMASTPGVEASYVERKEISLLTVPLDSRGVIYFVPPDRFARFTTEPGFSSLVVDGEGVRFREGRDGEEVDLSGSPMARGFVESFMVLWSGDRAELSRLYELELLGGSSDAEDWALRLTPRHAPLSRMIGAIVLRGDGGGMRVMTVEEQDGDRTVTTFEHVDSQRRFAEPELRHIFESGEPLVGATGVPTAP